MQQNNVGLTKQSLHSSHMAELVPSHLCAEGKGAVHLGHPLAGRSEDGPCRSCTGWLEKAALQQQVTFEPGQPFCMLQPLCEYFCYFLGVAHIAPFLSQIFCSAEASTEFHEDVSAFFFLSLTPQRADMMPTLLSSALALMMSDGKN